MKERSELVTIVALSTQRPNPKRPYHLCLPKNTLPQIGRFQEKETWVKGDMVYTVGFHRLGLVRLNKRDPQTGKRLYFKNCLGRERMREIYGCVLHGLGLGHLVEHI